MRKSRQGRTQSAKFCKQLFYQATNGGRKKDKSLFLNPTKKIKLRLACGLEKDVPESGKREAGRKHSTIPSTAELTRLASFSSSSNFRFQHTSVANLCKHSLHAKHAPSLLYLVFQTALCYSVVSVCFVDSARSSSPLRPEPAPERGPAAPELAFRRPESARKIHAKSFGP